MTPPATHVVPGATAKSPLEDRLCTTIATALVFTSVTVRAALVVPTRREGKVSAPGVTVDVGMTPVPARSTVCPPLVASSGMLSVPARGPSVLGAKATAAVHVLV